MQLESIELNGSNIAIVRSDETVIKDARSALDLLGEAMALPNCSGVIIDKSLICADFFDLSTRLAGEVLQKFTTYNVRLAIVGDFERDSSKSLKDFIYETNKGKHIFFLKTEQQAIDALRQ